MNKVIFWSSIFTLILALSYLVFSTLIPFIIAFIFAYILQPLINKLRIKYKIPHKTAANLIFIGFLGSLVVVIIILLPIIYQQIFILINKIPVYNEYVRANIIPAVTLKIGSIDPFVADKIKSTIESLTGSIFSTVASIFNNLWAYTLATINIVFIFLLVPVILVYFLRDWPNMIKNMGNLLPLKERARIYNVLSEINNLISGYIRGQLNVCLILSTYYSVGLYFLGLEPALLLGILSGFLIIMPFIGTLISFSTALIIGYVTFGFSSHFLYVIILYCTGLLLENYILTPKIIGDRIGLHPLWIMFAVLAFGGLFGLVGIFFAIPVAGIIKILLTHLIEFYKSGRFYKQ